MSIQEKSDTATFKQQELAGWNAKAKGYHDYAGGITREAAQSILKAAKIRKRSRLLDVASGPGYVAAAAVAQGALVIGVDFATGMVAQAKKNFPDIDFQQGDAEVLEFEDNRFDAVTCAFGLLHLAEPDKAIAEAWRVLRPGGYYVFTVWASPEKHDFFRLVLNAIETYGTLDIPLPEAPPIFRFSDPGECKKALMNAGFIDTKIEELPLVWTPDNPDDLITLLDKSSVRAAMLMEMQAPDVLPRIQQAIIEGAQQFRDGDRFRIAWPAVMAVAKKPT